MGLRCATLCLVVEHLPFPSDKARFGVHQVDAIEMTRLRQEALDYIYIYVISHSTPKKRT